MEIVGVEGVGAGAGDGDGLPTGAGEVGVAGELPEQTVLARAAMKKTTKRSGIITRYRGATGYRLF